ncbi:MAG: beta strand repeat-containing protein, partial [Opitutia bacterium]
ATGTLTKSGAGTLILSGANTFGGAVTISSGNLQIGAGSTTGSVGAGAIANSGTLEISRSDNLTFANVISGTGAFVKSGAGTLTLSGANSYSGATTVSAGVLTVSHATALGTSAAGTAVAAGATLSLSGGITVATEALSLSAGSGGSSTLNNAGGANIWSGNLTVDTGADAVNRALLNSDAGVLTISGNINLSAGTQDFVLRGDGDGVIGGQITGSQRLFKSSTGAGTWTLSGDNSATFTGRISVGNGAIQIASESNLGATPASFVSNQLTLGGSSAQGSLRTTASLSLSANRGVALGSAGGAFDVAASTSLAVNSVVSGSGALFKQSAGTLTLSGANSYSGATSVSAGVLAVSHATALGTSAAGTTVTGGANGASSLRLQGGITVTGESLALTVTADTTGNAALVNASGNNIWTGNITLNTGTDPTYRARFTSEAGLLTVSGNVSFAGTGTRAFVFGGAGAGLISGQISGSLPLFKDGGGTWTLSGNNTGFSGVATIGNGVLEISSESNLGATPASFAAAQLTLGSGASNQGTLKTTATTSLSANRGVTLASGGGAFDVADATTFTVDSVVTGAAALAKQGAGNLVLSVGNSYSGATSVTQGVLTASNALSLGTSAGATSVTSGAELRLQGGISIASEAVTLNGDGISSGGALRNLSGDNALGGAITLASASRINSDDGTLTLTGGITSTNLGLTVGGAGNVTVSTTGLSLGTGTLTKDGAGTFTIAAANTFDGAITISAGKLQVGAGSTTGSVGAGAISNSGTLEINRSDALTCANVITGTGSFIKSGAGNLTLSGANAVTGATTVSAGDLTVDSGALAGTSGVTVNDAILTAVN